MRCRIRRRAGGGDHRSGTAAPAGLKTFDPAALQTLLDTTMRDLLVPGAVVLLRTPRTNDHDQPDIALAKTEALGDTTTGTTP